MLHRASLKTKTNGKVRSEIRTCVYLMLQTAVFPLSVFSDDDDIDVLVPSLHPRKGLAVHHIGIKVKTGSERIIKKNETGKSKK